MAGVWSGHGLVVAERIGERLRRSYDQSWPAIVPVWLNLRLQIRTSLIPDPAQGQPRRGRGGRSLTAMATLAERLACFVVGNRDFCRGSIAGNCRQVGYAVGGTAGLMHHGEECAASAHVVT